LTALHFARRFGERREQLFRARILSAGENDPSGGVAQTGETAAGRVAAARDRGENLFGESLSPHPDEVEAQPKRFGAGRPLGSKNRSSDDLARMVQQIGGHPVLAMARIAGMSLAEIKGMLGCTRLEAFDRWVAVLDKLAPYVASKQPLAVAVSGKVTSLGFTVALGDGAQLVGPDAVAALFAQGRAAAAAEGFEVAALPPPPGDENESQDDGKSNG